MRNSERLWHLAHRYGLGSSFTGVWVEDREIPETVRLLGADSTTGVDCSWGELIREGQAGDEQGFIWAGRLNSRWTQFIIVGLETFVALPKLSEWNKRALLISWHMNSSGTLLYARDGNYATILDITRPDERLGIEPNALDRYSEGLIFDAQDMSWENDPDLPAGWLDYCHWEDSRLEAGASDDDYDNMPSEWSEFLELALDGYSPMEASCITSAFVLVGRIVGQEWDEAWMAGVHTRFTLTGH